MYEPSENFYTNVVKKQVRHITWSGKIIADGTEYPFTAEDIVKDSGTITNEIASGEMEIGTVYSSELVIGLYVDGIGIPRSDIYGAVIEINCTMSHGETSGVIPMGKYDIVEALQTGDVCNITAYDFMCRFDKEYPASSGNNTPYEWAQIFCELCDVELAQSDFDDFANSDVYLKCVWTENINTYRDAVGQLAAAMGCSAHMNRFGQLEFIPLKDKTRVTTIDLKDRFSSDIAQTIWIVGGVWVTNTETGAVTQWGDEPLILDLGENSFLQSEGEMRDSAWEIIGTRPVDVMLSRIFTQTYCAAVPVEAEIPLDPCLDLFDYVLLTNANYEALITTLIHKIGGSTKIVSAGANTTDEPKASGRGAEGKDNQQIWMASAMSSAITIGGQALIWREARTYTWEGLSEYTWGDLVAGALPTRVAEVTFTPPKEMNRGVVSFTVNYTLTEDATVKYIIRLDDTDIWELEETQVAGEVVKTITTPLTIWDRRYTTHKLKAYMAEVVECSI